MRSITIHKLDDELGDKLAQVAERNGTSLNQVVKQLLRKALGLDTGSPTNHRSEFEDLFGTWTDAEANGFNQRIREFDEIDSEDW